MADSLPPPQPPPQPAPTTTTTTTITVLSDDLLLEIFLRLPDVTTLARAAFTCRTFLGTVRSSPAFRRRFRQLRAPPLLAIFRFCPSFRWRFHQLYAPMPYMHTIVPADAGKGSGIAADFEHLLQDSESEWRSDPEISYHNGYALFFNRDTDQWASYSLHSRTLNICSKNFRDGNRAFLEFYTLSHDGEELRPSQVVCVHRDHAWAWARVAVFSSQTMEWQVVLPEIDTGGSLVDTDRYGTGTHTMEWLVVRRERDTRGPLVDTDRYGTGMVVNGFVCWVPNGEGCILALNTVTFQFSRMYLPPHIKVSSSMFQLGHTKDGEFCIVIVLQCVLSVWLWATDGDGVERFMLHKTFSLRANVSEVAKQSEEADFRICPMAVINGFVYLSLTVEYKNILFPQSPEWFLSFCLETAELNLLHKERRPAWCSVDPYIMVSWPSSLIHGKDSETRVTGNISEDDGHMCTEETSPVLFTALESFKEKLIDDDNSKFAEIGSFLLDDERNSLLNRITTLESGLAAARDHVLRIGTKPNSMSGMETVTSESELATARDDRVLRIDTESDSMEGMGRVRCWQMCKGMLVIVCCLLPILYCWVTLVLASCLNLGF